MFGYIDSFLSDPRGMLIMFLLALPGRLLAISAHEFAHAYVADRCGDHTARYLGRLTLNPLKHIDPIGFILMTLVGFGWAKPVPVNPRNYRNYRSDDLKVSLAGIAMNLLLFLLGCVILYTLVGAALVKAGAAAQGDAYFISALYGDKCIFIADGEHYSYMALTDMIKYAPYMSDWLIAPVFGQFAGYLTQMLMYFVITNLVLAIFNLIPMPPLDGYHVLNDLVLHRSALFANPNVVRAFSGVMMVLFITGILSNIIGAVQGFTFDRLGALMQTIFGALGII
jgi:Zn-dependent protease